MNKEDGEDKIENLKKSLYSRNGMSRSAHVLDLNKHQEGETASVWKPEDLAKKKIDFTEDTPKKSSFLRNIFILTFLFFVISIGIAAYIIMNGGNVVSPNKIDISIIGPQTVRAGEEASFDLKIVNQNNTPLELVDLLVEYPKGAKSASDQTTNLERDRISVGQITSGGFWSQDLKFIPFGEEGDEQSIKLNLEYRIPNSTSVFNKDITYAFTTGSSPLTLTVDALDEVNSNQDFSLTVNVVSNSKDILKNIILTSNMPFGFAFTESNPLPISKKMIWSLGDIEPQGKRVIKIKGKVIGEANQNRVFKFNVGTEDSKVENTLSTFIAIAEHDVNIKKPFLAADIQVDRKTADIFLTRTGEKVNLSVVYENNLPVMINDVEIEARIKGAIVDKKSVDAENGFYKSADDLLRWTKFESPNLGNISPGKGGTLNASFYLLSKDNTIVSTMRNQSIVIDLTIKGKRLSESGVPDEVVSTISKTIKVVSDVKLSGGVYHSVGLIENMGDIPPKVGKETQYTVVWEITNNLNNLENTKVRTILPSYILWTGVVSPANEKVTYNSDSREIVWDLGKFSAGTNELRKVSFQISFTPDLYQIGKSPVLMGETRLQVYDSFAKVNLEDTIREMNTNLTKDTGYSFGNDIVGE